jgi:FkbM family methyltransferase
MINGSFAEIIEFGGTSYVITKPGRYGCALWGPYIDVDPGLYLAEIDISVDHHPGARADDCCGFVDVTTKNGSTTLCTANLFLSRLGPESTTVYVPFSLGERGPVEVRLHVNGRAGLRASLERRIVRIDDAGKWRAIGIEVQPNTFAHGNYSRLYSLYNNGINLTSSSDRLIANMGGVSFYLDLHDDYVLAYDIFIKHEYYISSPRPKVIVDIGMNVGMASLFMANDPSVVRVHSFEPFSVPYRRALDNFSLNPSLYRKIKPVQMGLGKARTDSTVAVNDEHSIATSVRGVDTGAHQEKITIEEAGPVLKDIIERAESDGADVFMKVDCEGSEFGIFESMEAYGLFDRVAGFVAEWHKWWSPETTHDDLFRPLLSNGFVILDRTIKSDPWAGQFYAVRAPQSSASHAN